MTHKYGIYQTSSKSCVFYKQDEDGNQSTFNIFVTPLKDEKDRKTVFAYIDNDQINQDNWILTKDADIEDVIKAFGGWASDAPVVFELEAQKSITQCLSSIFKKENQG